MTDDRALLAAYRSARADQARASSAVFDAEVLAGRRRPLWHWPLRVVTFVVVVALAFAVVGLIEWRRSDHSYTDADYIGAVTKRIELLLSPDYRRPEQVKRVLAGATGTFYDEFAQSADAYTTFVSKAGTVSTGRVTGAGVSRRIGDDAEILVAATADLAAQADRPASSREFRLRTVVTPEDGVLKLSMVQYLP
ncbi:hypothetical protein GOEFS_091_00230 [Gordonia effusa NBRC 100432]|uniref:Uncharacterized protein n=1 Tax=Gordonia effusa NBRC 100432 TaxID=1077974 RepID=H0R380_9ACTN|nr:hypothetical protein [Gordonia effusa]GAB19531.1 hypothetical protein GOEFS_091_00230 [Gordonia effusa NBRC 100432]